MTAKKLIEFLQTLDPEREIGIESSYGEYSPDNIEGWYEGFIAFQDDKNAVVLTSGSEALTKERTF